MHQRDRQLDTLANNVSRRRVPSQRPLLTVQDPLGLVLLAGVMMVVFFRA